MKNAFSMQTVLRYQALISRKLFRPTFCNSLRHRQTAFSGPPPTEPAVGEYRPLKSDWGDRPPEQIVRKETDLAVIGGGLVGLCTAFFIKHRFPRSFTITVIEKDPLVKMSQYFLYNNNNNKQICIAP